MFTVVSKILVGVSWRLIIDVRLAGVSREVDRR